MRNFALIIIILLYTKIAMASTYYMPEFPKKLIGEIEFITTKPNDNLGKIAQKYFVGASQLELVNPGINPQSKLAPGTKIKLPTQFIIPSNSNYGIIINLPEMRLYLLMKNQLVKTYPIGIGKVGNTIPVLKTTITKKVLNPRWVPTQNIRDFNLEQGIVLPNVVPAGPNNPLGPYALYLGIPTYRIHSTNTPESIGRRASFGCIRMHKRDMRDLFGIIEINTPVLIVNSPTKLSWENNKLYLEAHPELEDLPNISSTYEGMVELIKEAITNKPAIVNWDLVKYLSHVKDGIPHEIGESIPQVYSASM